MKSFIIVLLIISVTVVGGSIIYLNHAKIAPIAEPAAVSAPSQPTFPAPEEIAVPKTEPAPAVATNAIQPAPAAISVATEINSDDSTNLIHKAVDDLLAAKNAAKKHELFQQLIKSGQIDAAIAELKQRMTDNPTNAEIPTTLGEAQLNEVRAMKESGSDDISAMGILAMQADQSFKAALKIDPQNWEAQFVKNASMYYWPANLQMDNQVVQNLSNLIDQQETMPSQPEFAQTYVVLGNEYQKIGQPDKAQVTWALGLQKFPNDPTLQQKVNGQ